MNPTRLDITLWAYSWGIPRFGWRLECLGAWLQLYVHDPLSKNTRLWLAGVGREVTHPVLYLSSFFYALRNSVVMTCLQILLGWLLAHAVHSPNASICFSSYFYILLFGLSNVSTTLTFWEILELQELTMLPREPWFGCWSVLRRLCWGRAVMKCRGVYENFLWGCHT